MSSQRAWVVWLVLAGVFLAGGVTGGFVSLRVAKEMVRDGRSAGQFAPRHLERLKEKLALTADQEAQIKPILEKTWRTLRGYRHDSINAMRAMETEITAVLTPAQQQQYVAMQEEHRSRWQKLTGPRGDGSDRRGPPREPMDGDRPLPPDGVAGDGRPPPPPPPN